jgi:hypothetical protein
MTQSESPFLAAIRESNRQGRDAWSRFAGHRERVTRILAGLDRDRSSLCILGAGNLNDVSLGRLLALYGEVHIVDVDLDAVRSGLARQGLAGSKAVHVHGPLDLTGILGRLPPKAGDGREEQGAANALLAVLASHRCAVPNRPCGVTVSAGALTQLIQSVVASALGPLEAVRVILGLRDKHLADLVHLTRPGGVAVLITDVVSTTTAPQLLAAAPTGLGEQMAELVAARNFFTGTNPYRIAALLEQDDRFRDLVRDVRLLGPWLWRVTADRQHLACAIVPSRAAAQPS